MSSIHEDLDNLDRLVDGGAAKDEIRSQIRLIEREVAALEADYARVVQEHGATAPSPQLQHMRGVWYASGDQVPFCPRCYEVDSRRIHLFGPLDMFNPIIERWDCQICNTAYTATLGNNFLRHERKT